MSGYHLLTIAQHAYLREIVIDGGPKHVRRVLFFPPVHPDSHGREVVAAEDASLWADPIMRSDGVRRAERSVETRSAQNGMGCTLWPN